MRTSKTAVSESDERDNELENIVGNLLIAEYQVDRLKNRLVEKIAPAHSSSRAKDHSAYSFKSGAKWYRVSIKVEEEELGALEDDDGQAV
jgi:hypothetical protein